MYKVLHLLGGEYRISVRTENALPFLRVLSGNEVRFWDFEKTETGCRLCSSLSDAKRVLVFAQEQGFEAEIESERGLPFLFAKYKKRHGLIVGLLLALALIFVSELFVWKVEIHGNTVLSDKEITEALKDYGIGVGSYIPKIPVLQAQNDFLIRFADLSSIAINIKGTHIEVELLERTHAPEIIKTDGFCNVVASEDGIVLSVEVAEGTARVLPGDVVAAGQLLISSFTVNDRNIFHMNHARGKIIANTYGSYMISIPLEMTYKRYTGKEEAKTTYDVMGKAFDLYRNENSPYELFDAFVTEKEVKLFGIVDLPIRKTTVTYKEYEISTITLTKKQAEAQAKDAFLLWLGKQTDKVVNYETHLFYDTKQNACVLTASVVYEKDIAEESPVDFLDFPEE